MVFSGGLPRGMAMEPAVAPRRKLRAIDAAERPEDLRIPVFGDAISCHRFLQ
jgi:hypothetical protein